MPISDGSSDGFSSDLCWFLIDPQKPELGDVAPGTSDSRQGLASLFNIPCTRQCDAEARIDLPRIGGSLLQSGPIQFGGTGIIAPRKIGVSSQIGRAHV